MAHMCLRDITYFCPRLIIPDKRFGTWALIDALLFVAWLERNSHGARRCVLNHGQFTADECNFPIR